MHTKSSKKSKSRKVIILTLCVLIAVIIVGSYAFSAYVNDYYPALDYSADALDSSDTVSVTYLDKTTIAFTPENPKAGIIFYPGGKVEYTAYAPLLQKLSESGYLCILLHMPYNLAVLDADAADGIISQFPEIDSWYMAGHSLGGAMASDYISKHTEDFDGLILFAAYSTADLSDSSLTVISLYGSEDQVLNKEKYKENLTNLPENYTEFVIDGGCHAYFGCYGSQEKDGTPSITNAEQIETAVDYITNILP